MSYNDEYSEITYLFTGNHSSVYDSSPLYITRCGDATCSVISNWWDSMGYDNASTHVICTW